MSGLATFGPPVCEAPDMFASLSDENDENARRWLSFQSESSPVPKNLLSFVSRDVLEIRPLRLMLTS